MLLPNTPSADFNIHMGAYWSSNVPKEQITDLFEIPDYSVKQININGKNYMTIDTPLLADKTNDPKLAVKIARTIALVMHGQPPMNVALNGDINQAVYDEVLKKLRLPATPKETILGATIIKTSVPAFTATWRERYIVANSIETAATEVDEIVSVFYAVLNTPVDSRHIILKTPKGVNADKLEEIKKRTGAHEMVVNDSNVTFMYTRQ